MAGRHVFAFIGDAASAAGLRLAGAITHTPAAGEEAAALADAMGSASIVLIDGDVAERLPSDELQAALASLEPLVAIAPPVSGALPAFDPAERVRAQLGLEAS